MPISKWTLGHETTCTYAFGLYFSGSTRVESKLNLKQAKGYMCFQRSQMKMKHPDEVVHLEKGAGKLPHAL